MKSQQRTNISVKLKDEDRDVEAWLDKKRVQIKEDHGLTVALSQVIMASLRKQMIAETGK